MGDLRELEAAASRSKTKRWRWSIQKPAFWLNPMLGHAMLGHDRLIGPCSCGHNHVLSDLDRHELVIASSLATEGRHAAAALLLEAVDLHKAMLTEVQAKAGGVGGPARLLGPAPTPELDGFWSGLQHASTLLYLGDVELAKELFERLRG